jgi:His/Glu/Gln/Arg/opine family amino acid ABC transporter permease subunit
MDFARMFQNATPYILSGVKLCIEISALSLLIGVVLGLITCMFRLSKVRILRIIAEIYVWIIRGTPMLVQAMIIYFGIPQLVNLTRDPSEEKFVFTAFVAGTITLSLNAGAYMSEIFRSGIQAVPKGQSEAARSLGMTKFGTMRKIVIPQAFKIVIPSLVNQFIITIKDSSILSFIGLAEIVNEAKQYVGATYQYFETYIFAALCYLAITSVLMIISRYIEKRLKYANKETK